MSTDVGRDQVIKAIRRLRDRLDVAVAEKRWDAEVAEMVDLAEELVEAGRKAISRRNGHLVLAACGHWWSEFRPDGLLVDPELPRACTSCKPTVRAAVGASPQGMAMVPVVYVAGWNGVTP